MVEYDEIRITTRREIDICESAIRKLERDIGNWEKVYCRTSTDFFKDFDRHQHPDDNLLRWHDSCLALQRWKERLAEHLRIMQM